MAFLGFRDPPQIPQHIIMSVDVKMKDHKDIFDLYYKSSSECSTDMIFIIFKEVFMVDIQD